MKLLKKLLTILLATSGALFTVYDPAGAPGNTATRTVSSS